MNTVFDILTSKAKALVLRTLYFQPNAIPLRHIAYLSDLPVFSVQHAVKFLLENGIVNKTEEGNNVLFELNRENHLYATLEQFFIIELHNRIAIEAKTYYRNAKAALDFADAAITLLKRTRQERTPK